MKMSGNAIIYEVTLKPFNNRPGHLYVEFDGWVRYSITETQEKKQILTFE